MKASKKRVTDMTGNCKPTILSSSIHNRTNISERPTEVDGKRFGDFEMDTIVGRGNHGAIVTLIERSTNMLFMRKLKKRKMQKSWHAL